MRVLIYALGGGLGHLTRGLALGRACARRGAAVRLLTNSALAPPVLPLVRAFAPEVCVEAIPSTWDRDEVAGRIASVLGEEEGATLVVDSFPRGLGGELGGRIAARAAPSVLIHRDLEPSYAGREEVRVEAASYSLILCPGEEGPLAGVTATLRTAPWLVADPDELLAPEAARERLEAPADRRLVVLCGAGRPEEVREAAGAADALAGALAGRAEVRFVRPTLSPDAPGLARWPLLTLLRGVCVLVGSGGYNTVREARAAGVPLVAVARERLYDRQDRRLSAEERVDDLADVTARVSAWLDRAPDARDRPPPDYENGARAAADAVLAL